MIFLVLGGFGCCYTELVSLFFSHVMETPNTKESLNVCGEATTKNNEANFKHMLRV